MQLARGVGCVCATLTLLRRKWLKLSDKPQEQRASFIYQNSRGHEVRGELLKLWSQHSRLGRADQPKIEGKETWQNSEGALGWEMSGTPLCYRALLWWRRLGLSTLLLLLGPCKPENPNAPAYLCATCDLAGAEHWEWRGEAPFNDRCLVSVHGITLSRLAVTPLT